MTHHLKNALTIFVALTGLWLTASAQRGRIARKASRYGYSNSRLSGTWRLNAGRSDDPSAAAERATRNLPSTIGSARRRTCCAGWERRRCWRLIGAGGR